MSMRILWKTLAMVVLFPLAGMASPLIDFSTLAGGTGPTDLGISTTLGGITAEAFYDNGGTWTTTELIARNDVNDKGLGVCSPNDTADGSGNTAECMASGGDFNELSQLENNEAIRLTLADGKQWSDIWLSSLDSNGGTDQVLANEQGKLCWGNSADINTVLSGTCQSFDLNIFSGGGVQGSIFAGLVGFDAFAKYLVFVPDGTVGTNNDYLVWGVNVTDGKGDIPVPEPMSLVLLGTGLTAAAWGRKRARK